MPLTIVTNEIPDLIGWFNGFIGYREIQKRTERVETKLRSVGLDVPALHRRYYFHSTYRNLVVRNRTFGKIDLKDGYNSRAISLIASIRELSKSLNAIQNEVLRARVIESLDPDRDIRELEHEMRAFVHYTGVGLSVLLSDDSKEGRFDFLVRGTNGDFELECKTFSESIGNPISIEDSIHAFRGFKNALDQSTVFRKSGIITLTVPARLDISEALITSAITELLSGLDIEKNEKYALAFEECSEWESLTNETNREAIINDITNRFSTHNSHSMITVSRSQAIMFVVRSSRQSRPANSIFDRLKKASEQFTKRRPAVVWGHFLGISGSEFKQLLEGEKLGQRVLDVFGHYLFKSSSRNHVCRLRLSADGDTTRPIYKSIRGLILPDAMSSGGPAYDLTSNVSRYDPRMTQ